MDLVLTFITGYQYYQKSLEYVKAEEERKKNPIAKVTAAVKAVAGKMTVNKTKTKSGGKNV